MFLTHSVSKRDNAPAIYPTQEECESGVFSLKTHQIFSVHTTPKQFENATITVHFQFVLEENSGWEIT